MTVPASRPARSVTVRAPAKINLHLGVGAPRADGFHPLATVYQAVGLYDDLTATEDDGWSVRVDVADYLDATHLPQVGGNIIDRAAELLAAHSLRSRQQAGPVTAAVHVAKEIPIAGGLAGGSADAAAALVALDRLWDLETSDDDLLALAAELGSDVPFALVGGTALGSGRGEVIAPVTDTGTWWWVIVPNDRGLSTPEVYRHFDRLFPDAPSLPTPADALLSALQQGDPVVLAAALHNDLQPAACDLRPDLTAVLQRGEAAGALRGIITGSGPTCVFLCESADHARAVAADLGAGAASGADRPVVLLANGPVAGAHVVEYP